MDVSELSSRRIRSFLFPHVRPGRNGDWRMISHAAPNNPSAAPAWREANLDSMAQVPSSDTSFKLSDLPPGSNTGSSPIFSHTSRSALGAAPRPSPSSRPQALLRHRRLFPPHLHRATAKRCGAVGASHQSLSRAAAPHWASTRVADGRSMSRCGTGRRLTS